MKTLLPILFILICPLMMLFMMRGMHGHGGHATNQNPGPGQRGILDGNEDSDVATLRAERDQLEARVEELETQMRRIERPQEAESQVPTPA